MSVCLRYTQNEDEAIEVFNDSFMKVFGKLDTYDVEKSFQSWFRRILINTAINYYHKHEKHRQHHSLNNGLPLKEEDNAISQLSYQELIALIQRLSPVYQTVFNLFVIDGFSHEEIAEALQISVGASKSNLSRARANLRVMLYHQNKVACKV